MNPDEAMLLFKDHYPNANRDAESAAILLKELQYLPQAIVQAAAYLRQNRLLSPSGYLQQFRATKRDQRNFLSKPLRDLRRELDSAGAETILATFAITFEQIRSQWPLAGSFLEIMACIDGQGIPGDLLRESVPEGLEANATGEALSKLIDFGLITDTGTGEGEGSLFVMHALVHVSAQEFISIRETMQAAVEKTGELLVKILPNGNHENWSVWKIYLPHVLAWTENKPITSEDTATIYYLMSTYLNSIGRYNEAEDKAKVSSNMRAAILCAEHPDTLASMDSLASTYSNQGRWTEAEELEVAVLEARKRVLGLEHPDTLASMSNLASTYRNQGRWKEAEELQLAVREARKRVLGQEHPHTLSSMVNLAATYPNQGRWTEAEELDVTVLETGKRVLGLEHPDTLASMGSLASTYSNQGRWTEAEELQLAVLEARKRVLGLEHPDTLTSMSNLASTYWNQGRWTEAEELEVVVLETRERVLGQEHPDTLSSMGNLAYTLHSLGRTQDAIAMMTDVLVHRTARLGVSHPDTNASQLTLEGWNQDVDDAENEDRHEQVEPNEHMYTEYHESQDDSAGEGGCRLDM